MLIMTATNISLIKGIGPKYQRLLNDASIASVEDLAAMNPEEIHSFIQAPVWRRPDYADWIQQAHWMLDDREDGENDEGLDTVDLDQPAYYLNRELTWLEFNRRVLEEALDEKHPLLERVKFLSIFSSNLDEFFMIRVSGLRQQLELGLVGASPDGMTPSEQLIAIRRVLEPMLEQQLACWQDDVLPKLRTEGINVLDYDELKGKQRKLLRKYFRREVFPVLTPLAFDPGHPFPHISNLSFNLAVVIRDPLEGERFARVKVPGNFPRLLRIPSEERAEIFEGLRFSDVEADNFVWFEDLVSKNLDELFPGLEVVEAYPFRVTRDADIEIEEDEAADLLAAIEEGVGLRYFGREVRLEVDSNMPDNVRQILIENMGVYPYQVYTLNGRIGKADLMGLMRVERPDLKDKPFSPSIPASLSHR